MNPLLSLSLLGSGAVVLGLGVVALYRRKVDRRWGELVAIDAGRSAVLRSERYRLVGRPDALRRRPEGTLVPVELKHRPAPSRGPFPSHRVQLGAYCLLVEEATGQSPPFGVLRYTDREVPVPWDDALRSLVMVTLGRATGAYDGRADPAPSKCAGCVWSPTCDASLAGRYVPRPRRAT